MNTVRRQINLPEPKPITFYTPEGLTKQAFCQQYALNRAIGHTGGLDGTSAVREAKRAWDELEKAK